MRSIAKTKPRGKRCVRAKTAVPSNLDFVSGIEVVTSNFTDRAARRGGPKGASYKIMLDNGDCRRLFNMFNRLLGKLRNSNISKTRVCYCLSRAVISSFSGQRKRHALCVTDCTK